MEIKGTIVQVLPPQSGISKVGNAWKKQEYILENNEGQFPRKICLTTFNQTADAIQLTVGQRITASFDIESREYNGRWYTDIRAWRLQPKQTEQPAPVPDMPPLGEEPSYAAAPAAEVDDLPF